MKPASLRWRLRWLVIGVLVAVLVPLGLFSMRITLREMDELADGRLAQAAHVLQLMVRGAGIDALAGASTPAGGGPTTLPQSRHTFESEVAFQVIDRAGRVRLATSNFAALPVGDAAASGFADIDWRGYRWRTYRTCDARAGVCIVAGERYDSRRDILRALWLDHALLVLLGLPLIALLVGWAVRHGLRPLDRLARGLASRAPGSREPVAVDAAPAELRPVVRALNTQLERLEDALERERRFSADVAHELRTPLTTSLISVEGARGNADAADADAALGQAQQALNGLARRVEQLLVLARLEAGVADRPREKVDLVPLAGEVIEELAPMIAERRVEVSLDVPDVPVTVIGHAAGLLALIRNLVDNALRHVAGGGHVLIALGEAGASTLIEVTDDGPGIPPERRAEVFARFHREPGGHNEGYGVGLSIVQRVAELHGATIELLDAPWGRGLSVRVSLPRAAG
ncbi:MAG: sensor histidine kinase N-terminal domain-containing protein [Xanthomonadaceae bacterium]|nr:sensor histidine kinase N-terminal domain-containing protein [Xanthomonadaceae bacterium]MDE1963755.1 sensor histidine kinase N-terminal domain-containing protein [Xanthomonadaceae bacterium]